MVFLISGGLNDRKDDKIDNDIKAKVSIAKHKYKLMMEPTQ